MRHGFLWLQFNIGSINTEVGTLHLVVIPPELFGDDSSFDVFISMLWFFVAWLTATHLLIEYILLNFINKYLLSFVSFSYVWWLIFIILKIYW